MRRTAIVAAVVAFGAGTAAAERLPVRTYTTADGLSNAHVLDGTRDRRGFLWFATGDGLSRFDGDRFETFGIIDGLPDPACNDVLETRDGALWVATGRGIARLDPDAAGVRPRFTPVSLGADEPDVLTLFEDSAGRLWIGSVAGLRSIDPASGEVDAISLRPGTQPYVYAVAEDRDHTLWVGTSAGLMRRLPDGTLDQVRGHPAGIPADRIYTLHLDREGRLWVGGAYYGIIAMVPPAPRAPLVPEGDSLWEAAGRSGRGVAADGTVRLPKTAGEIIRYTADDGLPVGDVSRQIFEDSRGVLWFGVRQMIRLAGGRLETLGPAQGLPADDLAPCIEDGAGNLWFCGNTVGVVRLSPRGLVSFGDRDGLDSLHVFAMTEDPAGAFYVVTWREGEVLNRLDGEHFVTVRPRTPPGRKGWGAWGWNQIDFVDRDGRWWHTTSEGLARYPRVARFEDLADTVPTFFAPEDGLPGRDVFRLFEDSRGDVWIATLSAAGVARWDRATDRLVPIADLPAVGANAFAEDATGALWIGYDDGRLARLPDRTTAALRIFDAADGLSGRSIQAMVFDHLGRLWIATIAGVVRIDHPSADHPTTVRYTIATGLQTDQTNAIVEDDRGRIYIGSVRGLDRIDPATGEIGHLTLADGLPNDYVNTAYRDRRGQLWVGTHGGLARILPDDEPASAPPPAYLVSVVAGGVPRALSMGGARSAPALTLGHDEGSVDIEFTSPSFAVGTPVLFQTRLDGADRDWSVPSRTRAVHYAHLAPGRYRFWVRATFEGGAASEPASVAFEVEAPVWRRPWFLALVAATLVLIGWTIYRQRVARLIAVERVRTRIATDLHDDLGSSLSRISILAEVAARRASRGDDDGIDDVARSARELVDVAADIVWSTDPQRDDLGSLLVRLRTFAGDLLEAREIVWHLEAPADPRRIKLGPDHRRHLYLVLKEAINNAARHSGARRVTIEVRLDDGDVWASVTDDGRGIDATRPPGNGLANMRERARQAGGSVTIDAASGGGTAVTLRIPVA